MTGATGFLGSHLASTLLNAGHTVIILKRSFSNTWRINEFLNDVFFYDIDHVDLDQPFREHGDINAVIHTATNYGRKGGKATEVFESNLVFPLRLLEIATTYNTRIFMNTDTFFNKDSTRNYEYLNFYSLSKRQFEEWGRQFALSNNSLFINIKLEHIYGPNDDPSKFTTYIVQSCINNMDKLELTPGEQKRDFIYIDDAVNAFLKILNISDSIKEYFQEYNVGTGNSESIRHFVEIAHSLTHSSTKLFWGTLPYRENEIMESHADISKIINIGWSPKYDIFEGLKKMIGYEKKYFV